VLESLEHAKKRGAPIIAEVCGYGFSCDAFHITAPCTDGAGAIACMTDALSSANLTPNRVQYVNAHGTSTPANDSTETLAIKSVFGPWASGGLMVSSTKSMTGHLLGALSRSRIQLSLRLSTTKPLGKVAISTTSLKRRGKQRWSTPCPIRSVSAERMRR
jgi:3-oxoacyl-(acyl-carrier-protein) synthase